MMVRLLLACCVVVIAGCECGRTNEAPPAEASAPPAHQPLDGVDNTVAPPGASAEGGARPEAREAKGAKDAGAGPKAKARLGDDALRSVEAAFDGDALVVMRNGARRIACTKACALENDCGFRDNAACIEASCDGDVRKVSRMDYCLALDDALTCLDAARCSCSESCWKRGECAKDHRGDAECERACVTLVQQDGVARYRENRCVLEHGCSDIAACGAL
jgi:hypothetical protein